MKKYYLLSLLFCLSLSAADRPVKAVYTYPSLDLTTNHVFRLYWSVDSGQPMTNWTILAIQNTKVIGTSELTTNSIIFSVKPGWNYVSMTASNEFGESPFYPFISFNPVRVPSSVTIVKP